MVGHIVVTVMNKKFENYFIKALHNAKIEEIKETYRKKEGFSVHKNYKLGNIICDVFVKNQEKSVIFDITVLPISSDEQERIKNLQAKAKALGYGFRVVAINKPVNPTIAIGWLNQALLNYLVKHPPSRIQSKAEKTHYEQVKSQIQSIEINELDAVAHVEGGIEVDLKCERAEDRLISETFPFEGQISLNLLDKKIKHAKLNIDDSHWY
ncbi:MAG: hypothetical protein DRR16_25770 [Candidatus Parabeggiatoa sp. nov. 3]|jgi:hypothetical protein|nr:MAG: hypothetical protein DRR00_32090 [Gammaproteobacteria bacterium]RKZ56867.1 MAG: hypothetical protein DRQ99_27830 [Gammaproteobacteria bacterium]RKZ79401.1 MAG: hypothetical protein DRR16_25770 [Gammaproteobacteria bacterium]